MLSRHSMTTLSMKYAVSDLLKKVRANREKHIADFKKAMDEYRKDLIIVLEKKIKAAKENQRVYHSIQLEYPVEFSAEYDRAIQMLEMTSDETVSLDPVLFAQLVQDEWDWKDQFSNSTQSYLNKSIGGGQEYGV